MPRSREAILPGSLKNCICPICKEVFSTTGNFDKHRTHTRGFKSVCIDPEEVGLVLSEKQIWISSSKWFEEDND